MFDFANALWYNRDMQRNDISKICSRCGKSLSLEKFYKRATSSDGLRSYCKFCDSAQNRKWYKKNCQRLKKKSKDISATVEGAYRHRFSAIKNRCNNPSSHNYHCYGGRGIKVKFKDAAEFAKYMMGMFKESPIGLEIDRINNDGHYERGNLRLVTRSINLSNRRKYAKK